MNNKGFEGKNELYLCPKTMQNAVEYWLNEVIMKGGITVNSIDTKVIGSEKVYVVTLKEAELPERVTYDPHHPGSIKKI